MELIDDCYGEKPGGKLHLTALPNLRAINTARSVKRNGKPVQRPPKFADRP